MNLRELKELVKIEIESENYFGNYSLCFVKFKSNRKSFENKSFRSHTTLRERKELVITEIESGNYFCNFSLRFVQFKSNSKSCEIELFELVRLNVNSRNLSKLKQN